LVRISLLRQGGWFTSLVHSHARHAYQIVRVLDVLFPKHAQHFSVIVQSKYATYELPMFNELAAITRSSKGRLPYINNVVIRLVV
jgi:hypothetical protein